MSLNVPSASSGESLVLGSAVRHLEFEVLCMCVSECKESELL